MRTGQDIERQGLDKLQQNLHSIYDVDKNVSKKAEAEQQQALKKVKTVNVEPIEEEDEHHKNNDSSPLQDGMGPKQQPIESPLHSNLPEPSPTGKALVTVDYTDDTKLKFDVTYNKETGDVMDAGFPHGENSFSSNNNKPWSENKIQDYATVLQSFGARGAKLNEKHTTFAGGISPENALGLQKAFNLAGNCKKGPNEIFKDIIIKDDSGNTYEFNKDGVLKDKKGNRYDSISNPIVGRVVEALSQNSGNTVLNGTVVDEGGLEMSKPTDSKPAPTSHQRGKEESVNWTNAQPNAEQIRHETTGVKAIPVDNQQAPVSGY